MTTPSTPPPGQPDPAALLALGLATQATDADTSSAPPPSPAEIAAEFPQLDILELIGRGGMGAVYKARQRDLDRLVALKILRPGLDADPGFSDRFTREARALAQLNHPGIVTLYEFGKTSAGRYFILMEFVDGVNLRQLLAAGRLAPREALAIVPPLCDALQYAHDRGLIHRDIKPENILVDRLGRVKIADFGLARLASERGDERQRVDPAHNTSPDLTLAGQVMGTPRYMAPEQRERPTEVDHRADLYALGVVFYQMLTGELPDEKLLRPPSAHVKIDVRLDEIVLRALEKDPSRRYAAASEFKTHVENTTTLLSSAEVVRPKAWHRFFSSRKSLILMPSALLVVALGFVATLTLHQPTPEIKPNNPNRQTPSQTSAPLTPVYTFGPIREVTLTRKGPKGGYDFETDKFIPFPKNTELEGPEMAYRWNWKNGVDVFIDPRSAKPGVLFTGTNLVEVKQEVWNASADSIVGYGKKPTEGLAVFIPAPDIGKPPATIVYHTQQGGVVLVQLMDATDEGDVMLRYKRILPTAIANTTRPPQLRAINWLAMAEAGSSNAWLPNGDDAPASEWFHPSPKPQPTGNPNHRFLCFWFSHPLVDSLSVADVELFAPLGATDPVFFDPARSRPLSSAPSARAHSTLPAKTPLLKDGWWVFTNHLDTSQDIPPEIVVRLRYSLGPWRTWEQVNIADFRTPRLLDHDITLGLPHEDSQASRAYIEIRSTLRQYGILEQWDVVALTRDGLRLERYDRYTTTENNEFTERLYFNALLSHIRALEIRKRPILTSAWKIPLHRENVSGNQQSLATVKKPSLKLLLEASPVTLPELAAQIRTLVARHFPAADINETADSFNARFATQEFTVRTQPKTGPSESGFILTLTRLDQPYSGATVLPSTGEKSHWKTFTNAGFDEARSTGVQVRLMIGSSTPKIFYEELSRLIGMIHLPRRSLTTSSGEMLSVYTQSFLDENDLAAVEKISTAAPSAQLRLHLTEQGAFRLNQLSQLALGRRIAILVNDRLVSAPKVMAELSTDKVDIIGFQSVGDESALLAAFPGPAPKLLTKTANQAITWLQLVDEGRYAQSWQRTASVFRKALTEDQWIKQIASVRTPLGPLVSRHLKSTEHLSALPGAPEGPHLVMQFQTRFTALTDAVETVTLSREPDGEWRASGYFIKPAAATFDPVVEHTWTPSGSRFTGLLDLDTGHEFALAQLYVNQGPSMELVDVGTRQVVGKINLEDNKLGWLTEHKIDLLGTREKQTGVLVGIGLTVVPVGPADWSALSAEDIGHAPGLATPLASAPAETTLDGADTWLFLTREGSRGILQIVERTENPRVLRFRYKRVRTLSSDLRSDVPLDTGSVSTP